MKFKPDNHCYICGMSGADSRDHIPPKNIFIKRLKVLGDDLITVPAHSSCNRGYSKDDEYFRLFLSVPGYWQSKHARELWDNDIFRSFNRSEATYFKKSILTAMEPVELKTPSGLYVGNSATLKFEPKRIERVIERIIRGIYFYELNRMMPLSNKVSIIFLKPEYSHYRGKLNLLTRHKSFADSTFQYWWNYAQDSDISCMFWLTFFETVDFIVFSIDAEQITKRDN